MKKSELKKLIKENLKNKKYLKEASEEHTFKELKNKYFLTTTDLLQALKNGAKKELKNGYSEDIAMRTAFDNLWNNINHYEKISLLEAEAFSEDGLVIIPTRRGDNDDIEETLDDLELYGEYNRQENYWLLPEDPDLIDGLEQMLADEFVKRDISVRFERN